jgi:microcystin-dependent protein
MLQTPRRKISYPNPDRSDRPDVPAHLQILALALDQDVIFNSGLDSDRVASPHQVGGGRVWWTTDGLTMWYDDGTNWYSLGNAPLNSPTFTGTPQAPTPPAGDISTKIATTAFVSAFFPPGVIVPYAGGVAPAGWLFCNGSAVDRTFFSNLFAVIGTTYGVGNGTSTFNIPDLRGRVPVGLNAGTFNVLGKVGGEETHATTLAEMPVHTHSLTSDSAGTPSGTIANNTTGLATNNESVKHTHSYTQPILTAAFSFTPGGDIACASTSVAQTGVDSVDHTHTIPAHNHTFTGNALGTHTHTVGNAGTGAAHNNLQPYITLNYIIKF